MPSPVQVTGTRPPSRLDPGTPLKGVDTSTPAARRKAASSKKGKGKKKITAEGTILNPPFDSRMRRIGSPLNNGSAMKRGWIQDEPGDKRVNFLFNPPQIDITHSVMDSMLTPDQVSQTTGEFDLTVAAPMVGSSLSLTLLYDRTYEMFSPSNSVSYGPVKTFGVAADIFAWYVYLGMLEDMPETWSESMLTSPPIYVPSYLVVGATSVFYGYPTGISVTYAHFTQDMIPVRASIDIGFEILPKPSDGAVSGLAGEASDAVTGWAEDLVIGSVDMEAVTGRPDMSVGAGRSGSNPNALPE